MFQTVGEVHGGVAVEVEELNPPKGSDVAVQLTIRFPKWLLPTAQKKTKLVDRYGRPLH